MLTVGRGWGCEACLIVIQRETRQQTAPSSLAQLPWGNEDTLAIGCFVCRLITVGLSNELYSLSPLENIPFFPLLASVSLQKRAERRESRRRGESGSLRGSVHPFKINVFKEGQSFPAFLGLSFILGPVAQITQ